MPEKKLGEILIEENAITEEQLQKALKIQKSSGQRLGQVLIKLGYVTEQGIINILKRQLKIEQISLKELHLDSAVVKTIPESLARRHNAVPVEINGEVLRVAMTDPLNVVATDDLSLASNYKIDPVLATEREIRGVIDKIYGMSEIDDQAFETLENSYTESSSTAEEINYSDEMQMNDTPIVRVVNSLIKEAVSLRASDIHIEPNENGVKVRYRIDGNLRNIMNLPRNSQSHISSRLKIMGQLDIAEKRIPQDGRFNMQIKDRFIDIRISTLPTVYGEKIVLRILDKENMLISLEELGLTSEIYNKYSELISYPYGMILVTGPTGSGKTTTLYSTLQKINTAEKNIITIEDPVEYILEGINQTAVNTKAGLTFANGLRSILRQDPDVIMVGEIRDYETAQISIQAANTGHLVFSTLHTNNSAGALTRLMDMGIEPYLIASSVAGVLAQRLVRVLCPKCKKQYTVPENGEERLFLGCDSGEELKIYKAAGCEECSHTGYHGRTSVTEFLVIDSEVQKLILQNASSEEIIKAFKRYNLPNLWEDAVSKVKNGITTVEEISKISVNEVN